jgi:anti-sigma-K factor RskA
MRSEKDIERSFQQANLDVEIDAETDRQVLDRLIETQRRSVSPSQVTWWIAWRSWALRVAAVVVIVAVIALLVTRNRPPESGTVQPGRRIVSTIELATAVSLEKAYRQGGVEAVENQYRKAFGTVRGDGKTPSVDELLADLENEMKDL